MCLVTLWKCYFPPPPTQNPPPHNRKTTKTPPPTPPKQQQKNQRSKARGFVGRSKSHRKSKSQRERERSVRGSGSKALGRRSVRGTKALGCRRSRWFVGRRSVHGFVDRFVDQRSRRRDRFVDRWVCRSVKSKAVIGEVGEVKVEGSLSLSLSICVFARESINGLKWKFSLQNTQSTENNFQKIYFPCVT